MDMALNANGEVYVLPYVCQNDNQSSVFKQKNISNTISTSMEGTDMLEIRITEIPQDLEDPLGLGQQSRLMSVAGSEIVSVMKHQEIDLDALNQILSRDILCISSTNEAENRSFRSQVSKPNFKPSYEVRNASTDSVVSYTQDISVIQHTSQVNGQVLQNVNLSNVINTSKDDGEGYVVYSDDSGVLNAVQVLSVPNSCEQLWLPTQNSESNCKPSNVTSGNKLDLGNLQLVPIKVEDGVVYIDAALSLDNNNSVANIVAGSDAEGNKFSGVGDAPSTIFNGNVLSFVVNDCQPEGLGKVQERQPLDENSLISEISPGRVDGHHLEQMQLPSLPKTKKRQKGTSNNCRSLLKPSVALQQNRVLPLKPNVCENTYLDKNRKEEHFSSLINQGKMRLSQKLQILKKTNSPLELESNKQLNSLAVVAISSDKTKDLTKIVLNTSQGEQVFKGKTSELISATPNLWCINSKTSPPLMSFDESSQNSDSTGWDDDEPVDEQPMSDALNRLGFLVDELPWVQGTRDERMWFCPEKDCKRLFPKLQLLKVHILGHYGERPYKCDFPSCKWSFYTHFKLKRHQATHLKRRDFKCDMPGCGRSFTTIYNLNSHKRLHKRPAEIACPVETCPALFQTRRTLELHLKEHGSDHAPYICPYTSCQKRYYTVNSVNSHIRSHQHKDDEIRCQWAGCGKVFDKPCRLRAHMRTHTGDKPYSCTYAGCTWAFSSSSKLKRHQHKHTNVRKFVCSFEGCGKMFMRSEHLKEHALTHSSERGKFQCPHPDCNMKFSAKSSLYVHSKKHRARMHSVSTPSAELNSHASTAVATSLDSAATALPGTLTLSAVESACSSESRVLTLASQSPVVADNICICPIDQCRQTFPNRLDLRQHVTSSHTSSIDANQQLDLMPLLAEDESLVAELVNIQPVTYPCDNDGALELSSHMDNNDIIDQVVIGSQSISKDDIVSGHGSEKDLDIEQIILSGSARSSITIDDWRKLKRQRLHGNQQPCQPHQYRQQWHHQQLQQQKQQYSVQQFKDVIPEDQEESFNSKQSSQEALVGLRPMDVVLGAGLLGAGHDIAHLLLPDDLAGSSDLYGSEDGILNLESGFPPSTINLRDLE